MASAVTVFTDDFESGTLGSAWGGSGTIQSTEGLAAFGLGLKHLRNDNSAATTLTLSGLPAHTEVTPTFDLAMWDSIDLDDSFKVVGGGATPLSAEGFQPLFGNDFPPEPGPGFGPGVQITPDFTSFGVPNLGCGGFRDSARSVSFTFAHSDASLVVSWQYPDSQGGLDESFGLDTLSVAVNAVPEPSTCALMALGLGLIGSTVARRRR